MPDPKKIEALDDEEVEAVAGGGRFLQYDPEGVNKYSWFVTLMMDMFPDNAEREKKKEGFEKQGGPLSAAEGPAGAGRR